MMITELPFRASTNEACHWLTQQTDTPWALTQLIESGLTPYVWLDYDADHAALFDDANGGYAAPIFFEADIQWLASGNEDVLITMTKDVYAIVTQLKPPGIRRALHELRFLRKDLQRLAGKLKHETEPPLVKIIEAKESQTGINKEQVLTAFSSLVKINLEHALTAGGGIFGDEGARVKGGGKKAKDKPLWNPVTLALGLNDVYRVPIPALKKAFHAHDFLVRWIANWQYTLTLLDK